MREEELGGLERQALRLHDLLARRAVRDLGLTPMVFDALQIEATQDEALELFEMVADLHDASVQIADEEREAELDRQERAREQRAQRNDAMAQSVRVKLR